VHLRAVYKPSWRAVYDLRGRAIYDMCGRTFKGVRGRAVFDLHVRTLFLRAWACCTVYDPDGRTLYDVRRCLRVLRVPYINYVSCVGVCMNVTCVVALYMHDARGRAVY
jgi:hypothetical protein